MKGVRLFGSHPRLGIGAILPPALYFHNQYADIDTAVTGHRTASQRYDLPRQVKLPRIDRDMALSHKGKVNWTGHAWSVSENSLIILSQGVSGRPYSALYQAVPASVSILVSKWLAIARR